MGLEKILSVAGKPGLYIKKVIQWYNILVDNKITDFSSEEVASEEASEEE